MTILWALILFCLCQGFHGQDWELIWEDNFDTFDPSKWDYEITAWGGGNGEFQVYTDDPDNTYVRDGLLFIKPTLLPDNTNPSTGEPYGEEFLTSGVLDLVELYGRCTNAENNGCYRVGTPQNILPPTMSGRIRTAERFSFRFGRVEIRAKMPAGDWLWPAIWMLPEDWVYGDWPRSGEIDIVEIIGNRDLKLSDCSGLSRGCDHMGSTLHWGPAWDDNKFWLTQGVQTNVRNNYADDFHLYELEWSENGMIWHLDGEEVLRVPDPLIDENPDWTGFWDFGAPWNPGNQNPWVDGTNMAPFDQAFHFLINVAVGGTGGYIPDNVINWGGVYEKPWENGGGNAFGRFWDARDDWYWSWRGEDAAMQVDYVRVYQRAEGK
jgi:beta-glucanase (GH16 family)